MNKFDKTISDFESNIKDKLADPNKGIRETKNHHYEAYLSNKGKFVSLGTFYTKDEALNYLTDYKLDRLVTQIRSSVESDPDSWKIFSQYVVIPEGFIFNFHGKLMIGSIDRHGYKEVILNKKRYLLHRVIAQCFKDNPNDLPCVNHIDGNKLNNNANNLEWVTYSQNTIHAYQNGLERKVVGENHHNSKLTNEIVKYSRKAFKDNEKNISELAKEFSVDYSTMKNAITGKTWRHINDSI